MTREEFLRRKMMFERGIFHEDPPKTEPTKPIKHTSMADNELLSFQERVRMGKKYYAKQTEEYFDVNAANEDNFRRMVENHAIIHGSVDPNNAVLAREVSKNAEQEYKDFKQKVKEGQQYVVNQKEEYIDINAINADNQRQMAEDHLVIHSELAQKFAKKAVDIGNKYFKYYKRIGAPGNYRYFYSKEEYDAYTNGNQSNKSGASAEASREAENRQRYEDNKSFAIMKKYKDVINKKITEESYNKNKEGDNKNYEVYEGNKPHKDDGTAADAASREAKERQEYEDKKAKEKEWYNQPIYRYDEVREKLSPEQNAVVAKLAGLPATVDEYVKSKIADGSDDTGYKSSLEYAEKWVKAYDDIMEKVKNPIKHSEMTAEQEYLEFRKKVKAAEKHFSDLRNQEYLEHHGIIGQKWGERRWQNADGTFNEAGKERYFGSGKKSSSNKEPEGNFTKKNFIWRTDNHVFKKVKENPDIYEQKGLSDEEIMQAIRRVPKFTTPDEANQASYGTRLRQELHKTLVEKSKDKDKEVSGLFKSKEEKELKKLEKEATRINENMNNSGWDKRDEIIKEVLKDPKYKDAFDEIDAEFDKESEKSMHRTEEIFNDFKENETLNLATAGITNMFNTGYYPNPTMEDLGWMAWFYAYEDGNQGDNTAEYLYATIDKQVSSKELNELYKQLHSKTDFLNDNATKLKEDVRFKNIDERNLKKIIDKKLDNKYRDNKAYWNLYAANEGLRQEPDAKLKKNYSEAKNITKKLQPSCGNSNGWDYLNKAIENLDLSATELKNMTQSDWDRINAEINRLKK